MHNARKDHGLAVNPFTLDRIPNEILARILLEASDSLTSGTTEPFRGDCSSLRLRQVCRRWKAVLDGCPQYWATLLGCAADEEGWTAILEKTGVVPLVLSTINRVPFPLQIDVMARAEEAYITRHDSGTRWNVTLSRAGCLPALKTLHLSRGLSLDRDRRPLTLDAPNLRNLSIDCDGIILAPKLHSLKLTNASSVPSLLKHIFVTCPNITTLHIWAPSCESDNLWKNAFISIPSENIEDLTVRLSSWTLFRTPPIKAMPRLRRLRVNIPTPAVSSVMDVLETELELNDVIVMLRQTPALRSLIIGERTYSRSALTSFAPLSVALPLCNRVDIAPPINAALVAFIGILNVPRMTSLTLNHVIHIGNRTLFGWDNAEQRTVHSPGGPTHVCSNGGLLQSAVDFDLQLLSSLSGKLRPILHGPIALIISTTATSFPAGVTVTYAAVDELIKNRTQSGIRLTAHSDKAYCRCESQQQVFVSFAHILSAFAWQNVTQLTITQSFADGCDSSLMHPDPFAVYDAQDDSTLRTNLGMLTGLSTLILFVSRSTEVSGLAIVRALTSHNEICPGLTQVHITSNVGGGCVSPSRGSWWGEICGLRRARGSSKSGGRTLAVDIIVSGIFCAAANLTDFNFGVLNLPVESVSVSFACNCT